jgi:putative hemolysin
MRNLMILVVLGVALLLTGCAGATDADAEIANPASVYCEEQGGTLEIRTGADGGQVGYCLFDDGSECEEWAYYRGECQPGQ